MSFRAALKEAIVDTGQTVTAVARRAGIPQQVLQRFMSGERDNLRLDTLEKLCWYLKIQLTKPGEVSAPRDLGGVTQQKLDTIRHRIASVRDYVIELRLQPRAYKELWRRVELLEEAIDELAKLHVA